MANSDYVGVHFPMTVGGGPGARHTLVLTPTVSGDSTPVTTVASRELYFAASAPNKVKHDRFSALVEWFMQHGVVVASSSTDTTVTLSFEQKELFTPNTTVGLPGYATKIQRKNAFALCAAFVTAKGSATGITEIAVTVDGTSQSS